MITEKFMLKYLLDQKKERKKEKSLEVLLQQLLLVCDIKSRSTQGRKANEAEIKLKIKKVLIRAK